MFGVMGCNNKSLIGNSFHRKDRSDPILQLQYLRLNYLPRESTLCCTVNNKVLFANLHCRYCNHHLTTHFCKKLNPLAVTEYEINGFDVRSVKSKVPTLKRVVAQLVSPGLVRNTKFRPHIQKYIGKVVFNLQCSEISFCLPELTTVQ